METKNLWKVLLMKVQITGLCKLLLADVTFEWFVSCMDTWIEYQMWVTCEFLPHTLYSDDTKWSTRVDVSLNKDSNKHLFVCLMTLSPSIYNTYGKFSRKQRTSEMCYFMRVQITGLCESLLTDVTFEWFVSCMDMWIEYQMWVTCVFLPTYFIQWWHKITHKGWCVIKQGLKQTFVCLFNDIKSQYLEYIW